MRNDECEMMDGDTHIADRSFEFALSVVKCADALTTTRESTRVMTRQLLRAATSIGANVEEAQAAESKADFIHKMSIAQKEARETRYWLRLMMQSDSTRSASIRPLHDEADQITRIITAITRSAKQRKAAPQAAPPRRPNQHHSAIRTHHS
ncbi:MAG: four helix bundle protein [Planctomycetota bacterium]